MKKHNTELSELKAIPEDDKTKKNYIRIGKLHELIDEEEARILSIPPGYQVLPKGSLKSIIIGEYSNTENQQTISNWVNECHSDIVIKIARFNGAKQKLEFLII